MQLHVDSETEQLVNMPDYASVTGSYIVPYPGSLSLQRSAAEVVEGEEDRFSRDLNLMRSCGASADRFALMYVDGGIHGDRGAVAADCQWSPF